MKTKHKTKQKLQTVVSAFYNVSLLPFLFLLSTVHLTAKVTTEGSKADYDTPYSNHSYGSHPIQSPVHGLSWPFVILLPPAAGLPLLPPPLPGLRCSSHTRLPDKALACRFIPTSGASLRFVAAACDSPPLDYHWLITYFTHKSLCKCHLLK